MRIYTYRVWFIADIRKIAGLGESTPKEITRMHVSDTVHLDTPLFFWQTQRIKGIEHWLGYSNTTVTNVKVIKIMPEWIYKIGKKLFNLEEKTPWNK